MENVNSIFIDKGRIKTYIFDLLAITAIYLIPSFSHLLSFPVYLIEPMRLVIILAVIHTSRTNAYLIAITLPVFSFLVSAHPSLIKSGLITAELLLNVFLFYQLSKNFSNKFLVAVFSILLSKIYYYIIKILLLNFALLDGDLFATPVYIQIVMTIIFSGYVYFALRNNEESAS